MFDLDLFLPLGVLQWANGSGVVMVLLVVVVVEVVREPV